MENRKDEAGQAIVEFVLVLVVAVLLLGALFDFGRLYMAKIKSEHFVQETALMAMDQGAARARTQMLAALPGRAPILRDASLSVSYDQTKDETTVVLSCQIKGLTPIGSLFSGKLRNISSECVLKGGSA